MSRFEIDPDQVEPPLRDQDGKLVKACPHCGGDEFLITFAVRGTIQERNRFDGRRADNTGMWDSTVLTRHKTLRCADCGKAIKGTAA